RFSRPSTCNAALYLSLAIQIVCVIIEAKLLGSCFSARLFLADHRHLQRGDAGGLVPQQEQPFRRHSLCGPFLFQSHLLPDPQCSLAIHAGSMGIARQQPDPDRRLSVSSESSVSVPVVAFGNGSGPLGAGQRVAPSPPRPGRRGREMTRILEAKGVSKWYGQVIAVNKVSFSVGPGVTGLLGPNGAGKSTLMKLITGQLRPSQGELTLWGERMWNNYPRFYRMGFCPEQ